MGGVIRCFHLTAFTPVSHAGAQRGRRGTQAAGEQRAHSKERETSLRTGNRSGSSCPVMKTWLRMPQERLFREISRAASSSLSVCGEIRIEA